MTQLHKVDQFLTAGLYLVHLDQVQASHQVLMEQVADQVHQVEILIQVVETAGHLETQETVETIPVIQVVAIQEAAEILEDLVEVILEVQMNMYTTG